MKAHFLALSGILAACGGRSVANGPEDMASSQPIRVFSPATHAIAYVDDGQGYPYNFALISTDATGAIGCSLIDATANPGESVSRVSFTVIGPNTAPPPCPTTPVAVGTKGRGHYDAWDAAGNKVSTVDAVGGAVSFSPAPNGLGTRCTANITLTFPHGDVFNDTFSYDYTTDNWGNPVFSNACSH